MLLVMGYGRERERERGREREREREREYLVISRGLRKREREGERERARERQRERGYLVVGHGFRKRNRNKDRDIAYTDTASYLPANIPKRKTSRDLKPCYHTFYPRYQCSRCARPRRIVQQNASKDQGGRGCAGRFQLS